jgi:hypothetical protein
VLKECWERAEFRERIVHVDLSGVTAIDATGRAYLAEMHRERAEFITADCLTKATVDEITQPSAPDCDGGPVADRTTAGATPPRLGVRSGRNQ